MRKKIIYFDTETSGLNAESDQIIQLSYIVEEGGKVTKTYDKYAKYDKPLPAKIIELTGITDEILYKEGVDLSVIAHDFRKEIENADVYLVAHNTQFDLGFIYHTLNRYYEDAYYLLSKCHFIDTLTIVKDRKSFPHKLENCIEHYSLDAVNSHNALDDTDAMRKLFYAMIKERDDISSYINLFGYNPKYGIPKDKFPFITYRSQPYTEGLLSVEDTLPNRHKKYA